MLKDNQTLEKKALELRRKIAKVSHTTGRGYLSTAYSSIELLLALYCNGIMKYDRNNPEWEERDRFILSKGHSGLALYMTLAEIGVISDKVFEDFSGADSEFGLHPVYDLKKGIEMSSGSLGHGLSFAVGHAYAAKLDKKDYRVYVLLGDGEMQEGSNWEALMLVNALKLDNLVVIIDRNNRQISDKVENIVPLGELKLKLESFGFHAVEVDGHDIGQITAALKQNNASPLAVIAQTVKGKGLSFVEDAENWHGRALSDHEWEIAKKELGIQEEML